MIAQTGRDVDNDERAIRDIVARAIGAHSPTLRLSKPANVVQPAKVGRGALAGFRRSDRPVR
jgi:hypothetical protein